MGAEQRAEWRELRRERERLRARLVRKPLDLAVRTELAASYRADDHLDQAGRWGLLVPGGTTELERRLFARTVARTGDPTRERVQRLILLPEGHLGAEEQALVAFDQLLEEERVALERERTPEPRRADGLTRQLDSAAGIMLGALGFLAALTAVLASVNAFLGGADARMITRVGFLLMLIPLSIWAAISTAVRLSGRRWFRAGVTAAILVCAVLLLGWLGPRADALLPWETE
ncbi:hypothetical protein NB037_10075 [Rathayibacter sp. ZW T2_19]|uniref:Uncharacterized protein n=1 Tax=Rathayibacter rubneri TaxID=2950106 RepID=A0A9X2ISJ5_9MICO|nr:hypothetical protein [Rathayibacter rubneri]MCM6762761.1 hypothetical protein [Rathayibacter rubneri]